MTGLFMREGRSYPKKGACFDESGRHRLLLWRRWEGRHAPTVLFVMLNPSTADAAVDDPTIRRCLGFASDWGFGRLIVANLFSLRATDPEELKGKREHEIRDPRCIPWTVIAAKRAHMTVVAWGTKGARPDGGAEVLPSLRAVTAVHHLGRSKDGHPKHPLYLAADTPIQEFPYDVPRGEMEPFKFNGGTFGPLPFQLACSWCGADTIWRDLVLGLNVHPGRCRREKADHLRMINERDGSHHR